MLHTFLRQRTRIEVFVAMVPELQDDKLTEDDWNDLVDIMRLLKPFKMLTILGEECGTLYGSVGSILWGFDMLLEMLEKEREKSRPSDAPFQKALDASWGKLNKYYNLTDKSSVYVVALMLDPRMKYEYFKRNWRVDWLEDAMRKMRSTFNQYHSGEYTTTSATPMESQREEDSFNIHKLQFGDMEQGADELTRYLDAPVLVLVDEATNDTFDPLEWWKGNAFEYPTLARIAFNVFSIPSMSVEPERVFSGYVPGDEKGLIKAAI